MAEAALHGVTKRFDETLAVDDVTLTAGDGEFVILLGPTGAGKTTTLRLIAGVERPDAGRVGIGGRDVTRLEPAKRAVALVFQQYSLYPHYSVYDNLAFPLRAGPAARQLRRGRRGAHRRARSRPWPRGRLIVEQIRATLEELAGLERNVVRISLPESADPNLAREVVDAIREAAERIVRIARHADGRHRSGGTRRRS